MVSAGYLGLYLRRNPRGNSRHETKQSMDFWNEAKAGKTDLGVTRGLDLKPRCC